MKIDCMSHCMRCSRYTTFSSTIDHFQRALHALLHSHGPVWVTKSRLIFQNEQRIVTISIRERTRLFQCTRFTDGA